MLKWSNLFWGSLTSSKITSSKITSSKTNKLTYGVTYEPPRPVEGPRKCQGMKYPPEGGFDVRLFQIRWVLRSDPPQVILTIILTKWFFAIFDEVSYNILYFDRRDRFAQMAVRHLVKRRYDRKLDGGSRNCRVSSFELSNVLKSVRLNATCWYIWKGI